jgi:protein kinase C substrate 80K-H
MFSRSHNVMSLLRRVVRQSVSVSMLVTLSLCLAIVTISVCSSVSSAATNPNPNPIRIHGVPKSAESLYTQDTFTCKDQSATISSSSINDDYCDCVDGSDEPGTSACSSLNTLFFCRNIGHTSITIPSSRVRDGICDCCDGSDEAVVAAAAAGESESHCENTCRVLAEEGVKHLREAIAQVEAGIVAKEVMLDEAEKLFKDRQQRTIELEFEIKEAEQKMNEARGM